MRPTHVLLLFAVWCCPRTLVAEELHWLTDAGKAWATAKEEKRPLLIYFSFSGCDWCNVMRAKTFGDPGVAQEINKSFIAVAVKVESEEDQKLAETFEVTVYPTVVIVPPDKKVPGREEGYVKIEGYKAPSTFLSQLAELPIKKPRR